MRLVKGSLKASTGTPLPTRCENAGSMPSRNGEIVVFCDDVIVGEFTADLLVEDQVIVELKVVGALSDVHLPQCRNYLRATGKPLCLLINFSRSQVEIRRITPSLACSVPSLACSLAQA
jgi:GxxExxY protein